MNTCKILDFKELFAERQQAIRERRYNNIGRIISRNQGLWLLGLFAVSGLFWLCVFSAIAALKSI